MLHFEHPLSYYFRCSNFGENYERQKSDCCCLFQEMNFLCWLYINAMLVFFMSFFQTCKATRSDKENLQLDKNFCEEERLRAGKSEVEYNSFLWSIDRPGSPPSYLFGTIHAPSHLVWRYIPSNSHAALFDATHVFTEVNLQDPNVINAIRKCRQLPGNQTIQDVLPGPLYNEFKKVLNKYKVSRRKWIRKILKSVYALRLLENSQYYDIYDDYSRLKPMWLTSTILQQWNRFYVKQQLKGSMISLDGELINIAGDTYQGGIEEVSSHCEPMDKLGKDKVHLALGVTLRALDKKLSGKFRMHENDIRRIINLYKCGNPMDTNRLETLFRDLVDTDLQKELAGIDEYMARELMLKRNVLMADTIEKKLTNSEFDDARMFFAVGAAHLLGNQSIITFLQKKGYNVRHVKPKEEIPATLKIKKAIMESQRNHTSFWKKTNENEVEVEEEEEREENKNKEKQPNIYIITKYEKNYVYYYSTSTKLAPCRTSLLKAMLVFIVLWLLNAG